MTLIHINKLSKKDTERTVMKNKIADIRPCFRGKDVYESTDGNLKIILTLPA